jgi:hypothetical protein
MSFGIPVRNGLSIGLLASTFLTSGSGRLVPRLTLNFLTGAPLDSRITFTRSTTATFVGSDGLIQTAAINAPRFDYNPVTLAPNGLLIEEQRVNVTLYSQQLDNPTWVKNVVTVSANVGVAPDGTTTADKVIPGISAVAFKELQQNFSSTLGVNYAFSCYVKDAGYRYIQLIGTSGQFGTYAINYDLQTGTETAFTAGTSTVVSRGITPAGNGWYRVSVVLTAIGTSAAARIGINVIPASNSARGVSWASDGTSGILQWGAQTEVGAFATSYIPTVASQVTRSADVATMTGTNFSSWYNQTEGTFVASADTVNIATGSVIMVGSDDSNRVQIGHTGSTDAIFRIVNVGVSANPANIAATKTGFKAALAYKQSNAAASAGGSAVTTSSPTSMVAHTAAYLGANAAGGLQINGHLRTITYYPSRLTNAQLQALTA